MINNVKIRSIKHLRVQIYLQVTRVLVKFILRYKGLIKTDNLIAEWILPSSKRLIKE